MEAYIAGLKFECLWVVKDSGDAVLAMRYRTTSESKALSIAQNCGIDKLTAGRRTFVTRNNKYQRMITKVEGNYQTFYEGYVINDAVDSEYLFTTSEEVESEYFNWLMVNFSLPLLPEWAEYLYRQSLKEGVISVESNCVHTGSLYEKRVEPEKFEMQHGKRVINLAGLKVLSIHISEEKLRKIVSYGLSKKVISITEAEQKKLSFDGMDDYMVQYAATIGDNLERDVLKPKSGNALQRSVRGLALYSRKLFPAQAACVNGIISAWNAGDKFVFVSEEMGCGKTSQAASAAEARYNQRWLDKNPLKTLKDCFREKAVNYRGIVLVPSHLCKKWKAEVEKQIPGARGIIVQSLSQLVELRKDTSRKGKEFYIFSFSVAKLDTYKRPVPTKIRARIPVVNVCMDCLEASMDDCNEYHQKLLKQSEAYTRYQLSGLRVNGMRMEDGLPTCIACGGHRAHRLQLNELFYEKEDGRSTNRWEGLVCPCCDNLLLRSSGALASGHIQEDKFSEYILTPASFGNKAKGNENCGVCGTPLWEDNVEAMDITKAGMTPSKKQSCRWKKIKFFANYAKKKANKMDKSGYALKGHELELVESKGVGTEFVYAERSYGPRRYSLARYCKKYLKGAFDFMIADEAHLCEGIRTEQSIAMHSLKQCVKFSMPMTGTLTNGTAQSLFALMWIFNPGRMVELGYRYDSESLNRFNQKYGVLETEYTYSGGDEYGYSAAGKGRQLTTPRVRPGISPMVFPDLLLEHTVMLNIADMAEYLPPLNEYVEEVPMNGDVSRGYNQALDAIKKALRVPEVGAGLTGKLLQFGLSYPDKPYGRETIWSLKMDDWPIVKPDNLEHYSSVDCLTPKEERLVEIVKKEMAEGRDIFVYTEYSGKEESCVDERLQEVIEKHCNLRGQVEVLKSTDVPAVEREEYIKSRSDKVKVWVTNYRNVDTGIDFIGEYEGRKFNYPTIIFFQTGMSLYSVWQASRRHYRLNQTEECRTYYIVFAWTFQKDVLEMMAKKISAASAIQGNFSASALENMAGTEDPAVVLAKKLLAGETGGSDIDVADLLQQTRQKAVRASESVVYVGPEAVTYYDIMGDEKVDFSQIFEEDIWPMEENSLFEYAESLIVKNCVITDSAEEENEPAVSGSADIELEAALVLLAGLSMTESEPVAVKTVKASKKKTLEMSGQFSFF